MRAQPSGLSTSHPLSILLKIIHTGLKKLSRLLEDSGSALLSGRVDERARCVDGAHLDSPSSFPSLLRHHLNPLLPCLFPSSRLTPLLLSLLFPRRHRSKSPSHKEKKDKKEAKAAAKREREAEDARAVAELSMYTSNDNPFNDANLGVQFKWVKKSEKEKKAGMSTEEAERRDALRRIEAKVSFDVSLSFSSTSAGLLWFVREMG